MISASVVIITAAYILWTLQRVYLGPEYKGPHGDHLYPMTQRELAIAAPLLALAICLGVYPQAMFRYMTPSVDRTVDDLAAWTRIDEQAPRREWRNAQRVARDRRRSAIDPERPVTIITRRANSPAARRQDATTTVTLYDLIAFVSQRHAGQHRRLSRRAGAVRHDRADLVAADAAA